MNKINSVAIFSLYILARSVWLITHTGTECTLNTHMHTHTVCVWFFWLIFLFPARRSITRRRQNVATRGDCSFRTDFAACGMYMNRVGCVDMTMSLRETESNIYSYRRGNCVTLRYVYFVMMYVHVYIIELNIRETVSFKILCTFSKWVQVYIWEQFLVSNLSVRSTMMSDAKRTEEVAYDAITTIMMQHSMLLPLHFAHTFKRLSNYLHF